MMSVTCNVCAKNIAAESDRIYCFGGCEQILHSRCADLSVAAATAVRENSSLVYMCFGCKKKQTTLNDIQKQCSQLDAKIDNMHELVNKHESMLTGLKSADLKKIESTLLPNILSAIKNALNNNSSSSNASLMSRSSKPGENNLAIASYADVMNSAVNPSVDEKRPSVDHTTTVITPDDGGVLRSGKRRIVLPRSTIAASNISQPPFTPKRKSNEIARIEQTVLLKPKKTQSAEKTKNDICAKLDPVAFGVIDVRLRELGEVAVRCGTKDLAAKFVNSATAGLSGKYTIAVQKPLKPRIKIIGFADISEKVLIEKLKKQNNLLDPLDLKVIRVIKNEKQKTNQMSAILETDSFGFDTLMKLKHIYLGWERCRLVDATDALRCYNCSTFGHKAVDCTKPACCPKCAGEHKIDDCEVGYQKCINCNLENAKRNPDHDELLNIAHSAWSYDCPILQKHLAKAKQKIDFSC